MYEENDAPEARLICHLSESGLRDAVRHGEQARRTVTHHLYPGDEAWEEFHNLEPVLFYRNGDEELDVKRHPVVAAEITVGRAIRYEISPDKPLNLYDYTGWGADELLEGMQTWTRPALATILGDRDEATELDSYLTVPELLAYERKLRDRSGRSKSEEALRKAINEWRLWSKTKGASHVTDLVGAICDLSDDKNLLHGAKADLTRKTTDFLRIVGSDAQAVGRLDDDALNRVMTMLPEVYEAACDAAESVRNRVKQQTEAADARAWVSEHGSSRLRKAADAKLLSESLGAYRDERLGYELGDSWKWRPQKHSVKGIVNPSEDALDALLIARERDPHANLWFETPTQRPIVASTFLGREIYAYVDEILDAWHGERDVLNQSEGF